MSTSPTVFYLYKIVLTRQQAKDVATIMNQANRPWDPLNKKRMADLMKWKFNLAANSGKLSSIMTQPIDHLIIGNELEFVQQELKEALKSYPDDGAIPGLIEVFSRPKLISAKKFPQSNQPQQVLIRGKETKC